jgi:hypothetical protein
MSPIGRGAACRKAVRNRLRAQADGTMRSSASRMSTMMAQAPRCSARLLEGRRPLIQPHELRPAGVVDQLTRQPVRATFDDLGWELPNVDLTEDFTDDDIETLHQASDDAGGILVFTNQKPEMTVHDHVRFARRMADYAESEIEPHSVAAGHPDAPEILEIVREASAHVVFGENWHSDNSFLARSASFSILRATEVPRLGVNDTLFSSCEAAYEALSPTMQNLLLDLNAFHSANKARTLPSRHAPTHLRHTHAALRQWRPHPLGHFLLFFAGSAEARRDVDCRLCGGAARAVWCRQAYGVGHAGNSRAAMEGTSTMRFAKRTPVLESDVLQVHHMTSP